MGERFRLDTRAPRRRGRRVATRTRPPMTNRTSLLVLCIPLILFLLLPLCALLQRASFRLLLQTVQRREVLQAVTLSLTTASVTTVVTIVLGTPVAQLLARHTFRGRTLLETLIEAPMVLPPAVAGVGLLLAFGRRGIWGSYLESLGIALAFTPAAVVMAQLFVAAPFYVKSAVGGFLEVDQELEQAAELDGASAWQVFRHVTVPLSLPALLGGAVMTWARALGEFGATILFAGNLPGRTQTMPLAIYLGFELDLSVALTLAVILLACSFGVLILTRGLLKLDLGR